MILDPEAEFNGATGESVLQQVLAQVAPPVERMQPARDAQRHGILQHVARPVADAPSHFGPIIEREQRATEAAGARRAVGGGMMGV